MTTPSHRRGPQAAAAQVSRMLALVPYIARRPGVSISELSDEFGVDPDQIVADLNLLMVCGEPGYYPNELIDVVLGDDGGTVSIAYGAGIDRPVRLSPDEAVTLTVALQTLADMPGLVDTNAVHSLLAKLEAAAGDIAVGVSVSPPNAAPALGTVREALNLQRRIRIRYYTASRDAVTERDIDPIRLLVVDGHSYLEGYCYRAEAVRRFRVDRIDAAHVLPDAAQQALWIDENVPSTLFTPSAGASSVILELTRAATWVAEYYLVDVIQDGRGSARDGTTADSVRADSLVVRLYGSDDEWLVRLVLSLGADVHIVDRPDLDAEVRLRATEALAAYGGLPHREGLAPTADGR
ncbi:MAG: WYL domain-containing protein [Nakamurella sp.]